jgi:hypothetical protein
MPRPAVRVEFRWSQHEDGVGRAQLLQLPDRRGNDLTVLFHAEFLRISAPDHQQASSVHILRFREQQAFTDLRRQISGAFDSCQQLVERVGIAFRAAPAVFESAYNQATCPDSRRIAAAYEILHKVFS